MPTQETSSTVSAAQSWGAVVNVGISAWAAYRNQRAANQWYKAAAEQERLNGPVGTNVSRAAK